MREQSSRDATVRMLSALIGCGSLIAVALLGWLAWFAFGGPADERAEQRRRDQVEAALAIEDSARIEAIVADHGFHNLVSADAPLIPPPPDADETEDWWGARSHGDHYEPSAKGAIVTTFEDERALDRVHHELPEHLRADSLDELGWIALLRWTMHQTASERRAGIVSIQHVDARVVELEQGRLVAQATHRASAPLTASSGGVYLVSDESVARLVERAVRVAAQAAPFEPTPSLAMECPVDAALAARTLDRTADPSCRDEPLTAPECVSHCLRGHSASCLRIAFAHLDRRDEDEGALAEARPYLLRTCAYGEVRGCVHWATSRMSRDAELDPASSADPALGCVARVLAHACEIGGDDHRGCAFRQKMRFFGMGMPAEPEAAAAELRRQCASVSGAACMTLGELQARGAFGLEERGEANANYERACEAGWTPIACEVDAEDWPIDLLETHGGG